MARWIGTGVAKSKVRCQNTTVICLPTQSPATYRCVLGQNHKHFCDSASASLKHNSIKRTPLSQNSHWEAKDTLRMPIKQVTWQTGRPEPLLPPTLSLLPAHHISLLTFLFSTTLTPPMMFYKINRSHIHSNSNFSFRAIRKHSTHNKGTARLQWLE